MLSLWNESTIVGYRVFLAVRLLLAVLPRSLCTGSAVMGGVW